MSFAKNLGENIVQNISKSLSSKYCQKLLDHAQQLATGPRKTTSKRETQKTVEATGDLNGNTVADKITKVSRTLPQNSFGTWQI